MDVQEINEAVRSQEADYNELRQIFTNIKKDTASRKTQKYITERKTRLTEVFTRTSKNHSRLQDQDVLCDHKYITTNYFGSIKTLYTQAIEYLSKCEKRLQVVNQLYEPEDLQPEEERGISSPKLFIQLFRINQIQKKLQSATQLITEEKTSWYLESVMTTLQKQWQEIEETHVLILMEDSTLEHSYFQENMFERTQTEFDLVMEKLFGMIGQKSTHNNHKTSVKLPQIIIPTFSGSYESWNSFYDLFLKIIHEDKSLSDTEKMQYLKTHVRGDAAKLIKHLTVCDANYIIAWNLLTRRYKNERLIITKHIDNILSMSKIKRSNAANLKNLHDTFNENLEALKSQNIDISTWDPVLTRILSRIWDSETDEKYEHQLIEPNKVQEFSAMMQFLEKRFKCLETSSTLREEAFTHRSRHESSNSTTKQVDQRVCWFCQSREHSIYQCAGFKTLSVQERNNIVNEKQKCKNCLTHETSVKCHSEKSCGYCGKRGHHSYLHHHNNNANTRHAKSEPNKEDLSTPSTSKSMKKTVSNMSTINKTNIPKTTLLATALIKAHSSDGTSHLLRVLCDQGSEASFCTEEVAQLLAYPRIKIHTEVIGIADEKPKTSKNSVNVTLQPRFPSEYRLPVTLIILPKLTGCLPEKNVPELKSDCLQNKLFADPTYYKRGPIDIILGAQEYSNLLLNGLHKMQDGIIAQNTEFGWILSGICGDTTNTNTVISMMTRTTEVQQLNKFWELEEIPEEYQVTNEDQACENYYQKTTIRNPDGTYTVKLPFKNQSVEYGNSRKKAIARLLQLERKFDKDENLRKKYQDFLNEYLEMGHMRKVSSTDYYHGKYYIPHQPVIREDSLTTKLRVVFDASSKSSTNISLNDNMFTGPRLQQELAVILLRWRKHKIAFMADIEKMYRYININKEDYTYQRILWRNSPKHMIDEYELTTVTYGTAAAPYLAIKTLQQLAADEEANYPIASQRTLQDFYVDDILSGDTNVEAAKKLQENLINMLRKGGFKLRKWSSNSAELLENIPNEDKDDKVTKIPLDETRKSLGVLWSPLEDSFWFQITINENEKPTKRFILSEIAKIFDPLGWLAPVVINMKLMIQELWTNGTEWDQPVEETIKTRWIELQKQLKTIEKISIPRWCHFSNKSRVELHGFSDASEKAYGAVIYCRIQNNNTVNVTLLQAKSKVAPKKQKTTLPKLELCAALLLTQLMEKVITGMEMQIANIYCWTDSMITLGWIKGEAERWKTFVANRVSEIQRTLPEAKWSYVNTLQNPADLITRGIAPNKLQNLSQWWNGPEWLKSDNMPSTKTIPEICEEIKRCYHITIIPKNEIWIRFSSFKRMIRVLSYCYRFVNKQEYKKPLSCKEINSTTKKLLRLVQQEVFAEEYKSIKAGQSLKKGNRLSCLDPFIDNEGLLRVGGRLQNSSLPYDQKHPILLSHDHHVTLIIIRDAHLTTLHGGNSMTLAYIRQKYWILGGKRAVKSSIRKCVKCTRYRSSTASQKMGSLPKPRVTESYPFSHTGVDYAGPISVRTMKGRGHKSYKGYIAIFVCLSTKAVHLELVGDLSAETFIAALRRFMARRGPVSHMYSDNATNFVGTANYLYKEMLDITQSDDFQNTLTNIGTQWHFIPPSSPHFGGIWEAGVKSMKHHLRRVIGEQTLTYEEMSTFLHQTEACLNSRPLCALSEDINDNIVLTPSHFLIGREAVGVPDPLSETNTDHINRWKQIQKMKKDFWGSWTKDYLHQLQQRYKWKTNQENLSVGTLVIIKDEKVSPSKWPLAKIKEIHTGNDDLSRVVTLQKSSGTTQKRSIHTLIPLPVETKTCSSSNETKQSIQTNTVTILRKNKTNQPKRCNKISKWFTLLFIMLQILGSAKSTTTTYSVKTVPPGFYVEKIGTASIDRGIFRIEINYEKQHLEQDLVKIKTMTSQFSQLCTNAEQITTSGFCKQLQHHLLEEASKFERTKEYLTTVNQIRKKRGIWGELLTAVFGVNDEVYRDIDTLNLNQKKLIEAANHQTKFMISTISQVNKTEERIKQKLIGFQTKLNQVIGYIESNNHWFSDVDHNSVNIRIMQTYQLAYNYMEEIMDHYNGLLEIYLTKATVYSVLTPKNVTDLISSANKKLPSKLRIVQQQLLDTKIYENKTHIKVYAYFPIQEITKYTLMYVTPVPKINSDKSAQSIEVPKAYIGLDYNNEMYFDLNYDEFKRCLEWTNHFICFPGAVKNMQLKENCIVNQLFKNQTHTKCPTKTYHLSNKIIWKQLYMPNTWLFIVRDRVTTSILCDGQREEFELQNVGVIRIADNCIIKTTNNILTAKRIVSVPIVTSYSKQIDFPIVAHMVTKSILNITKEEEVVDHSKEIFQNLVDQEKALQTELDSTIWNQISSHAYLTSAISCLIMFLIFLFLVCYGPAILRWIGATVQRKTRRTSPEPANQPARESNSLAAKKTTTRITTGQPTTTTGPMYSLPHQHETIELYQLEHRS